jgi:hypothetical protein
MGKKKKPKWITDLKGIAPEELRVLAQAIEKAGSPSLNPKQI